MDPPDLYDVLNLKYVHKYIHIILVWNLNALLLREKKNNVQVKFENTWHKLIFLVNILNNVDVSIRLFLI